MGNGSMSGDMQNWAGDGGGEVRNGTHWGQAATAPGGCAALRGVIVAGHRLVVVGRIQSNSLRNDFETSIRVPPDCVGPARVRPTCQEAQRS
jgi:hypothetical protein